MPLCARAMHLSVFRPEPLMQLSNLTPFDTLGFDATLPDGQPYLILTMSVGYRLRPQSKPVGRHVQYTAEVIDDAPLLLVLADLHHDDNPAASLRQESDLAPLKAHCDVLVIGHAYSPKPAQLFEARLQVQRDGQALIDKTLSFYGERQFQHVPGLSSALRANLDPAMAYQLPPAKPTTAVPLRYELAFGGACQIANRPDHPASEPDWLINEVCFANPIGCGWLERDALHAWRRAGQTPPSTLPAPRIMRYGDYINRVAFTRQRGQHSPAEMAAVRYPHRVAGFGPLGKAWASRLARSGTYDEAWENERMPLPPKDMHIDYWNSAPDDQQMPFPAPHLADYRLTLDNLCPGGGRMAFKLPPHRGFVQLYAHSGLVLAHPMAIDTMEINTDSQDGPQLRLVWRARLPQHTLEHFKLAEFRFEMNPDISLPNWARRAAAPAGDTA